MKDIFFRPKFSQPMVSELTRWIERTNIFNNQDKEDLFRKWLEDEILGARYANFDEYTLSTMRGQIMRGVFIGMFLESTIGDKQMAVLKFDKEKEITQ